MKKKDLNQFKREIKSIIKEHYSAPIDMFRPTVASEAAEDLLEIIERAYEQGVSEGGKSSNLQSEAQHK